MLTRPEPSAAIELRSVTKRYGQKLAIDAVDLTVPQGTTFGLLGPNGAIDVGESRDRRQRGRFESGGHFQGCDSRSQTST